MPDAANVYELGPKAEKMRQLYDRGYAFGSTGNLSIRMNEQIWITPSGRPLNGLVPDLASIDSAGTTRNDKHPSKEFPFHLAIDKSTLMQSLTCTQATPSLYPA